MKTIEEDTPVADAVHKLGAALRTAEGAVFSGEDAAGKVKKIMNVFGPFVLSNLDRTGCQTLVDLASKVPNDLERNALHNEGVRVKNNADLRIALKSMLDLGSGPGARSEKASFAKVERALQLCLAKAETYVQNGGERDDWMQKAARLLELHKDHFSQIADGAVVKATEALESLAGGAAAGKSWRGDLPDDQIVEHGKHIWLPKFTADIESPMLQSWKGIQAALQQSAVVASRYNLQKSDAYVKGREILETSKVTASEALLLRGMIARTPEEQKAQVTTQLQRMAQTKVREIHPAILQASNSIVTGKAFKQPGP